MSSRSLSTEEKCLCAVADRHQLRGVPVDPTAQSRQSLHFQKNTIKKRKVLSVIIANKLENMNWDSLKLLPALCLQRLGEKNAPKSTCVSHTFPKQQYRNNVCDGSEGGKKAQENHKSHVVLRGVQGSPWGLSLSCSPPWNWGLLHPQHPLRTRN